MPSARSGPPPSRNSVFGTTPVARTTASHGTTVPSESCRARTVSPSISALATKRPASTDKSPSASRWDRSRTATSPWSIVGRISGAMSIREMEAPARLSASARRTPILPAPMIATRRVPLSRIRRSDNASFICRMATTLPHRPKRWRSFSGTKTRAPVAINAWSKGTSSPFERSAFRVPGKRRETAIPGRAPIPRPLPSPGGRKRSSGARSPAARPGRRCRQ